MKYVIGVDSVYLYENSVDKLRIFLRRVASPYLGCTLTDTCEVLFTGSRVNSIRRDITVS